MTELDAPPTNGLPTTRAAHITDELRRMIQTGELAPGMRLPQTAIAKRFGVSTTPVREAFSTLAREGLVQQQEHRGVVVFAPSLKDVLENYDIRGALEPLAARMAAERMSDADLAAIDKLVVRMRKERVTARYHDLNRKFHQMIYAASDRPTLATLIESLRDASDAYLRLQAFQPGSKEYSKQVHEEHEAIAEALRHRDGQRVHQLVIEHLTHNRERLESVVKDLEQSDT